MAMAEILESGYILLFPCPQPIAKNDSGHITLRPHRRAAQSFLIAPGINIDTKTKRGFLILDLISDFIFKLKYFWRLHFHAFPALGINIDTKL
jgi:hypothetical protein